MNICLQQIDMEEWEILADLEKKSASELFHPLGNENEFRDYLRKSKVFYILLDNKKVGTISYEPKDDYYEIDGMTVLPAYRRKGIASLAFQKLIEEPKVSKEWRLVTHPQNTASLLIYLKAGFVIKGWKDNYFGDGQPRLLLVKS